MRDLSIKCLAGMIIGLFMTGCNLPSPPTSIPTPVPDRGPTPTMTESPPTPMPATPTPSHRGTFTVAVLVDLDSEPVTREQAEGVINEASRIMAGLTDFTLTMIDFREVHNQGGMGRIVSDYLADPQISIPNGILLFSFGDQNFAKTMGGYSLTHAVPGYRNPFQAKYVPSGSVYVGVMNYGHKFARCGYGDSEIPIGRVSIGGECRNQPGIACIEKYGYQMCSSSVDDLYASTPTYFISASFVHEMMHPFGPNGNMDHYWSPDCTNAMTSGASTRSYNSVAFDLAEADAYVNMCPFVFDNFVNSYHP
jgi:hypothetical protein